MDTILNLSGLGENGSSFNSFRNTATSHPEVRYGTSTGVTSSTKANVVPSKPTENNYAQNAPNVGMAIASAAGPVMDSIKTNDPRGAWDTLDPVYHLAGGRESKVGNGLSDAGVALTKSGNPWLMLAGAGLKIVGGLTNAAFGLKTDKEKLAGINEGIAANSNYVSKANSFDDIKSLTSYMGAGDVYEGGWFSGGEASRKNKDLKEQAINAKSWAERSLANNIFNIDQDMLSNELRNYSALGGPIETMPMDNNMSAINYGFMSDYLATKKKQAEQKNQMNNLFMGTPKTMFDLGGDVQMHGGDYSNGAIHIDAGGTHEMNPNDGVQMGTDREGVPNLVEEGEVVFNDYVYSARIEADEETKKKFHLPKKKDITFADVAKKLEKESADRPNDPISTAGLKAMLDELANQQERQKQEMEAERAKAAFEALSPGEQTAIMQRAAQEEAMAQQAAMQQETMAQQQAQPSPEEQAMMQQQAMQADGSQAIVGQEAPMMAAEGGKLFATGGDKSKKNAGTWKTGDSSSNWQAYTKNGLRDYLLMINDEIADAKTDAEKKAIREKAIKTVNNIQKAYSEAYQANLTPSERNEKVEALQKAFQDAGGNAYFGNIASNINLPKGHNTADTEEKGWVDGYWGPRTSIRNWGSTEYGDADYYKDLSDLAAEAGLTYAPGEYKYGDNTLYQLGMAQAPVAASPEVEPELVVDYGNATPEQKAAATEAPAVTEDGKKVVPNHKADWLRYAGLFSPAVELGMMSASIGRPDFSGLNAAVASGSSPVNLADAKYIGDYMRYIPLDRQFHTNQLLASSRATDRALLNSSSPAKAAGLLANGYNTTLSLGNLARQSEEFNREQYERTKQFNRGTNQYNADAYNRLSQFNAEALNRGKQYSASLALQAAKEKMDADAGWYNSLYGNVSGLFKGLGELGRENATRNMVADMAATGIYGNINPDNFNPNGMLRWETDEEYQKRLAKQGKKSNGGKMKRRRGLTF